MLEKTEKRCVESPTRESKECGLERILKDVDETRIAMQYTVVGINVDVDQGMQATLHVAFLKIPNG